MLENRIFAHLSTTTSVTAICGSRITPIVLPQNPTYPAVSYQRIGGRRENDLSQGYIGVENAIVQVDSWATSFSGAAALSSAVVTALCAATVFKAVALESPLDLYEDDIQVYRRLQQFSIWDHE